MSYGGSWKREDQPQMPSERHGCLSLWLYVNAGLGILALFPVIGLLFDRSVAVRGGSGFTILLLIGVGLMIAFIAGNILIIQWKKLGIYLLLGSAVVLLGWRLIAGLRLDILDLARLGFTFGMYIIFIQPNLEDYK